MPAPAVKSGYISNGPELQLNYLEWGDPGNPDLLLAHGWTGLAESWSAVAEALEDRYHVIAPDHRGHGASMDAADPPGHFGDQDGWRLVMDDLGRVIDTLREREPGALVLGAEGAGLRRLTRERCDVILRLPISDAVESLNLATAAAVALYALMPKSE